MAVIADNDQRTVETGRAWAEGFAPGCPIPRFALPPGRIDPVFAPLEAHPASFDPASARAAVAARLPEGGFAEIDARNDRLFKRLDAILCAGPKVAGCGVGSEPTALRPDRSGHEPRLSGALAEGSEAAQILTLEYAEGFARPGWGRLKRADIESLGSMRAQSYRIVYRTPEVARAFGGPTLERMLAAIDAPAGSLLTVLVGHDSNIAAVSGLLDLHWKAPGFAADDPPPSGAIGIQILADHEGRRFVRTIFRSPSLDQIRSAGKLDDPRATLHVIPLDECNPTPTACPIERFRHIIDEAMRA